MGWNAKNGSVPIGGTNMSYASFGHGERTMVILPGLSDGLATVKGKALLLARPYQVFFDDFTVYMFSRKDDMPEGYTIRDMAEDQARVLKTLGIDKACVLGVSQGGMIAQYLAIDHPELVEKLVIAVSASRPHQISAERMRDWLEFANNGDHKSLMIDTAENSYSPEYLEKYRRIYPVIGMIGKPKDYRRFLKNAEAIIGFNAYDEIDKIKCPTLIIGGEEDKIVGPEASYEMRDRIPDSELYMYEGLGHAAYEEAKDFNKRIFEFFK